MERNISKLRRWCIRRKLDGWPVTKICGHARIPRRTFYFWWKKYEEGGFEALEPQCRRPKTIHRTPKNIIDRVIEIRKAEDLNEKAIAAKLKGEGITVSHYTIYRYLSAHGLIKPLKHRRKKRTYISWSRKHPDSLWQTDLCIYKRQWLSTFLDDCSRYVVAIRLYRHGTADNIIDLFDEAISEYGKPKQVITDHGTQYWSVRGGTSAFTAFCREQGIQHILGGIGKPTTLGKIERFHRTFREQYSRHSNLEEFRQYYNFKKPHRALDYATPASVYLV